ncbi:MAG: hypothetical protein IJU77_09140 [Butyrivibrio sp.]|nr:hypothetical protein [Butyrivibrio sp.]
MSLIKIADIAATSAKTFERTCRDYFDEKSEEADLFRASYEEFKKSQKAYIDARFNDVSGDELSDLEAKHTEIQRKFIHSYRRMTEKRISPLYESYKDYRPEQLGDFISIMGDIIEKYEAHLIMVMGLDVIDYR